MPGAIAPLQPQFVAFAPLRPLELDMITRILRGKAH
jgi:hypothetical protein